MCERQERRSKEKNKTKSGYINSLPFQTQLCSCETRHKRHTVLFMSSRPWFLYLSYASNHMTSGWPTFNVKNTTGQLKAGCSKVMSGGHGKWAGG